MGWCDGTDIFDGVAEAVLEEKLPDDVTVRILKKVIKLLEDQDWDCQPDSDFIEHEIIGPLIQPDGWNDEED